MATQNEHRGKTYTLAELKDLVSYADARNVTIVPEYEMPGHSAAANRAAGPVQDPPHQALRASRVDQFRQGRGDEGRGHGCGRDVRVFRSSPYFHIGGDEADLAFADQNVEFQAAMKKHNLPNQHQLYRQFVVDMNEIVKRHGKRMIVWEGFGREPNPDADPQGHHRDGLRDPLLHAHALVSDGYRVINASWTPLYVVNANCRPPAESWPGNSASSSRLGRSRPTGA